MGISRRVYEITCILKSANAVGADMIDVVRKDCLDGYEKSLLLKTLREKSVAQCKMMNVQGRAMMNNVASSVQGKRAYSTNSVSHASELEQQAHGNVHLQRGAKKCEKPRMTQSEVPSTRLARIFHYGSLAAGMGFGAAQQGFKELTARNSNISVKSLLLSPQNIERMARKFSKMRGAALKVGQMMSFQDLSLLPKEIQQILLRVQNSAQYMPPGQFHKVMVKNLGANWREQCFASFEDVPEAAALIGQVHKAVTSDLTPVMVKVQYPGVVDSIDSDLDNLLTLLTASSLLPPGLFLDRSIGNARVELKAECDYLREAHNLIRFKELLKDDPVFEVPRVFHQLCNQNVLTMERMRGTEIVKGKWGQETKDWIATNIMRLCLMEIKQFRFMQTDPNWANYLFNEHTGKIELLDFGASRDFSKEFVDNYVAILRGAVKGDRDVVEHYSKKIGFLTGLESRAMINSHVDSVMVIAEAFSPRVNNGKSFNFKNQTITERVKGNIGVMLRERLTPPPEETYSMHRKLSGIFLLCDRLGATVPCELLFKEIIGLD